MAANYLVGKVIITDDIHIGDALTLHSKETEFLEALQDLMIDYKVVKVDVSFDAVKMVKDCGLEISVFNSINNNDK